MYWNSPSMTGSWRSSRWGNPGSVSVTVGHLAGIMMGFLFGLEPHSAHRNSRYSCLTTLKWRVSRLLPGPMYGTWEWGHAKRRCEPESCCLSVSNQSMATVVLAYVLSDCMSQCFLFCFCTPQRGEGQWAVRGAWKQERQKLLNQLLLPSRAGLWSRVGEKWSPLPGKMYFWGSEILI